MSRSLIIIATLFGANAAPVREKSEAIIMDKVEEVQAKKVHRDPVISLLADVRKFDVRHPRTDPICIRPMPNAGPHHPAHGSSTH